MVEPPAPPTKLLWICLASTAWSFCFGLGSQVVSHFMSHEGCSNTLIGLNHGIHYLGLAAGSLAVPTLMRYWPSWCVGAGLALSGLTMILFPYGMGAGGWFALRFANGFASALCLVPLETIIGQDSPSGQKSRNFGFYAVALTLGGALGIWSGLHGFQPGSTSIFFLGGIPPLLALLIPLRISENTVAVKSGLEAENQQSSDVASLSALDSPRSTLPFLAYGTAWCQGFLEGGMLAFLSLYLVARGMSQASAGDLMGVTLIGVILFQVPISWLGDRWGRVGVLLACYGVVLASLAMIPFCEAFLWLAVWLFLFGGCSGAMYPLGLSLLGNGQAKGDLAKAYAWYLAIECLGSQMGAPAMGFARDGWGQPAMFAVGAAVVLLVLVPWLGLHIPGKKRWKMEKVISATSRTNPGTPGVDPW